MGVITLQIAAEGNSPPASNFLKIYLPLDYNELYPMTLADFANVFVDVDGDALEQVKITALPLTGSLLVSAAPANVNDVITSAQLTAGVLTYQADPVETLGYSATFYYTASDVGSSIYSTNGGSVYITVDEQINNLPPTEVGDGTMTIAYGETGIFTRAMFTTLTSPTYSDPEGDVALNLLVESVPLYGDLFLSGVLVVSGQVISFSEIDAGSLSFVNNSLGIGENLEGFNFKISDAGSGEYTE